MKDGSKNVPERLHFNEQEIKNFIEFARVLKRIHVRLIKEGYVIEDGKIHKPKNHLK